MRTLSEIRLSLHSRAGLALSHVQGCRHVRAIGCKLFRGVEIRDATLLDIEHISSILNPEVVFSSSSLDPTIARIVALWQGRVIGFVELIREGQEDGSDFRPCLSSLCILQPYFRGLGVGWKLADCAIELARKDGAVAVWLIVDETNKPAITLYRKLGFEPETLDHIQARLERETLRTASPSITMVKHLHER